MNQNKGVWIGVVAIVVLAALGLWWIMAGQPLSTSTDVDGTNNEQATTTTGTNTTGGATDSSSGITRVNRSSTDIVSIINGLEGSSSFNSYFKSTGVAASISATGNYTIFVPTNGAFGQLPAGTVSNLSTAEKKRLVQYHIVSGRSIDVDAMVAGNLQALSGDTLNFSFGPNKIPMVNSAITITEYKGKNGVVFVIDNVLLPPKKTN